ncbi:hypothetical protein ACWD3I_43950 [Streptomyces sp. NPDC002817]|uniref:hypothetical protein n=1 Tax=Streptomyces sp. NPDC088357 TaxID=3154655 RepID=UPI003433B06B
MPRFSTPRFTFAPAVLLVALQFIGVLASGTSGPTGNSSAPVAQEWSATSVVADRADGFAACGDAEQIVDPPSWLVGRDRHRSAAQPSGASVLRDQITALPPGALSASHRASRSSAAHSLTSLQTFRC